MLATAIAHHTQRLSLSGSDWMIHDDAPGDGAQRRLFEADLTTQGWIPSNVPGNIQADLEAAHELTPIWYGEGDPRLWEVARKDWWYCKDFDAPESFAGKRTTIVFDGVDFECEVWLNGQRLGANRGMFRRFWFDLGAALRPGQSNRLAVRIARMPAELEEYLVKSDGANSGIETEFFFVYANNKIRRVLKDLKSPANCSYDWGTNIYTLGIWKDVTIESTGPSRIEWLQVQTTLDNNYTKATVQAKLDIDAQEAQQVKATVCVSGHGVQVESTVSAELLIGANRIAADVALPQPALWWPNGHGAQPLYDVEVVLTDAVSGDELDIKQTRIGVREIRWEQVEGAPADFINPFQLMVNGKPIRTMGSNLVSPDLLFGRNAKNGVWFIRAAQFCGMNTLRLHGGGVTLPACMYDAADELGIMISHEFPVANCVQESDPEYLSNLDKTCRSIIRQIRNHPSIIEYSGGNELNWKAADDYAALNLMKRVTAEEDDRIFRATCPMEGSRHSPWHYDRRVTYAHYDNELLNDNLEKNRLMRYGEFGSHTPSNIEVWHREIPPASQWPIENVEDPSLIRKNVFQAVFTEEFWLVPEITEDLFGMSENLEGLIKGGQFIGGEGLRYSMDALRRRGRRLGGFTNWDYNEPWPNGAGSFVIDYDGRTLMNYDFVKQALAPVALTIKQTGILYDAKEGLSVEFWLVSDAATALDDITWRWRARDRRGEVFAQREGKATIASIEAQNLGRVTLQPPSKTAFGPLFLELEVLDAQGSIITERMHVFGMSGVRAPLSGLIKNTYADRDDDTPDALNNLELPDNPANLAYVGNGASIPTTNSRVCSDFDLAEGLNDGKYGPSRIWAGTCPQAWFQIDLGKLTTVGRFKLGRDRHGHFKDRTLNYLKLEASADGQQWTTLFEQDRLAALAGDRTVSAHEAGWLPIVHDLAEYLTYRPTWTMEVFTAPTQARYIKATLDPKPGAFKYAALDEFEVYAPAAGHPQGPAHCVFSDAKELRRPVKRTTLTATTRAFRGTPAPGCADGLELVVTNTGAMTALFCEPYPLLNYRTDLLIENKNVCIPPGETRTFTINAPCPGQYGLTLAQTGWRIGAWNADDVIIEPSSDVLLAVGRQDRMTRGFLGYDQPALVHGQTATVAGRRPEASQVPYLLEGAGALKLEFAAASPAAGKAACLRLHTADRSAGAHVGVEAKLNGQSFKAELPAGYGLQKANPAHLAEPASVSLAIPAGVLKDGGNILELRVAGSGWLTWDALDLVSIG